MKRACCAEMLWALVSASVAFGCASGRVPDAAPEGSARALDSLLVEGQALGGLFAPTHLLYTLALLAAALGLNALIQTLVKLAWRLGFDGERRWARTSGLLRLVVLFLAGIFVLRGAFVVAPVLTSGFVLAFALGALFLSGFVPNAFVGIELTLRRRIRVGDRVTVGAHEGVVREVGLSLLHLRSAAGATVLVPNRLLNELPVVVERARNSVPVRVRIKLEQKPDARLLETLRQVAALSPYRGPESLVDISRDPDDEFQITVEIQAWSARAYRDARAQLESALRRALEEPSRVRLAGSGSGPTA